jgi:type I restriction enzyme S subunit
MKNNWQKVKLVSTIKESDIPYKLPSNWNWYYWGDLIANYQQGLIRSNRELGDNGFEYFKMNNISEKGTYDFDNLPKTEASKEEVEKYKINGSDFFINVRNSMELVGKSCVIGEIGRTILYNHMLVRILHKGYVANEFINAFLNIPSSKKMIDRCKKGTTTVIALYQEDLYKIPIAIPDKDTHDRIVSFYKAINEKISLNNRINDNLPTPVRSLTWAKANRVAA